MGQRGSAGGMPDRDLLGVDDVAEYFGVGRVTVWRWCRDGTLPCAKVGKSWRVRREALSDFLRRGERPGTLAGRLRAFLEVPDNVVGVAETEVLARRLDAAFFRVGEARGGLLVKFRGDDPTPVDKLRGALERDGLGVSRLEDEGRLRFVAGHVPAGGRIGALRRILDEEGPGRTVWASFDWAEDVDLEVALSHQGALTRFVQESGRLVVSTSVLERLVEGWSTRFLRRAQGAHLGTVWARRDGLTLSRTTPLPPS
jgi:excisionase family DNA binding protein